MEERKPRENSRENSRRGNNPRRNRKNNRRQRAPKNSKQELLLSTVLLKLLRVDVNAFRCFSCNR